VMTRRKGEIAAASAGQSRLQFVIDPYLSLNDSHSGIVGHAKHSRCGYQRERKKFKMSCCSRCEISLKNFLTTLFASDPELLCSRMASFKSLVRPS
jgi:hypothetical protein